MIQLFRGNPGLAVVLALVLLGALACSIVGYFMARSGASLRPIYWLGGFMGLIILPQLGGHVWKAVASRSTPAATDASPAPSGGTEELSRNVDDLPACVGPDVDRQLVADVRKLFAGLSSPPDLAVFAPLANSDTVLLARFQNAAAAAAGWRHYLAISGLDQLRGTGDAVRGYAVSRPAGDRAYAVAMGPCLGVWTGADDGAIRRRMALGGFRAPASSPLAGGSGDATDAVSSSSAAAGRLPVPAWMLAVGLAAYVFVVVLYFFKGAAWAGSTAPRAGVAAIHADDLAVRLEAINALDVPFSIERGERANELIAMWRYADAKWVDLARAHGMRRTFRIRMTLDEAGGTVRATDYAAGYDWSAGRAGARIEWTAMLGIVFFQYEHQRVFGLQIDEQGHPTAQLSYAYTFNLAEMKSPLIDVVTKSGWTWRPTIWQGPTWLRWLTE